jgi:hypothetical protein
MRTEKEKAMATLWVYTVGLSLAAFAASRREVPFIATEVVTWVNFGTALDNGANLLILNARANAIVTASDPRVAGKGTVNRSGIWHTNKPGLLWGSFHLSNARGTWDGYWQGTNSLLNGQVVMSLAMTAEGSGAYHGLVFRATCTAFDDDPIQWTGCVVHDSPEARPYRLKGWRLDCVQENTGMLLDPLTLRPTGNKGVLVRIDIATEVGEATCLGHTTEQGLGLLDPVTGVSSMMGTTMPAGSKERGVLRWVAQATTDLRTIPKRGQGRRVAMAEVHFAGGTGQFEDATGRFSGRVAQMISPTPVPKLFHNTFQYEATGTIRFSCLAKGGD